MDRGIEIETIEQRAAEGVEFVKSLLGRSHIPFREIDKVTVPAKPGVYVVYEKGELVYVGKSGKLRTRIKYQLWGGRNHYLASHLMERLGGGVPDLRRHLGAHFAFQYQEVLSDAEAKWIERFAISVLRPRYNGGAESFGE